MSFWGQKKFEMLLQKNASVWANGLRKHLHIYTNATRLGLQPHSKLCWPREEVSIMNFQQHQKNHL